MEYWDAPKTISGHHEPPRQSAEHYDGREEFLQAQKAGQGKRVCDSLKFSRVFVCFRTARVPELGKAVCLDFCTQRGRHRYLHLRKQSFKCSLPPADSWTRTRCGKFSQSSRWPSTLLGRVGRQVLFVGLGPTQQRGWILPAQS